MTVVHGMIVPVANNDTNPRQLVLLFYDGYEWRAREGLAGIAAQLRRFARFAWRTLRRKQVHTGFYTAFLALKTALERYGCEVRVNDFATARKNPEHPIGVSGYPSVLAAVHLPNPAIFGPGDFGDPRAAALLNQESRFELYIQPSDWFRDYYRPACGNRVVTWFAGIDTEAWADASNEPKSIDVLIYDKIRWHREREVPAVLDRLIAHLDALGLRWKILKYGGHHRSEFAQALKASKSLAFLCEHETQGLAYQEAMAMNVPVFAWDEGEFVDPWLRTMAMPGLDFSAVPYFDARCGLTYKREETEAAFDQFWSKREKYAPREYVLDTLSMEKSAIAYLALYARTGSRGS